MAYPIAFNRRGIFGLETIDVKMSANDLTYVFESHPYVNSPYNGLLLVHFTKPAPEGARGDMPIYFESNGVTGSRKAVTKAGGKPLLAEDIHIPSYNLFFYDFRTNVVEAVSGVVTLD